MLLAKVGNRREAEKTSTSRDLPTVTNAVFFKERLGA